MKFFRKMIGGKADEPAAETDLEQDFKALASEEHEAARNDANSGLVALYPELSKRRKKRGFADLDFDDYVPELDDYEPGQEGGYLSDAEQAETEAAMEARLAQVRARLQEDLAADAASKPEQKLEPQAASMPADDEDEDDLYDDDTDDDYDVEPAAEREDDYDDYPDEDDDDEDEPAPVSRGMVHVPAPAAGRSGGRRAGRVKTRLLGFDHASASGTDPFENARQAASAATERYPVGWIVVLEGPGRGASFTLFNGVSPIGRGDDQAITLDFGDNSISRSNHAMIAYDSEQQKFFLGHGGKANIVRLNAAPVLSTEELSHNDLIRIGETTLKFVAFCGPAFDWFKDQEADRANAAIA